jgi:hypothetical protein
MIEVSSIANTSRIPPTTLGTSISTATHLVMHMYTEQLSGLSKTKLIK